MRFSTNSAPRSLAPGQGFLRAAHWARRAAGHWVQPLGARHCTGALQKEPPSNGVVLTSSAHSFIIMVIQKLTGCPPLTALQRGACMRRKGASKRPHVTGAVRVKGRRSVRAIWREPKGFHCAFAWEGRRALQRLCLLSQVRRQTVSSISLTLILCANTGAWQYPKKGGPCAFFAAFYPGICRES